MWSRRKGSTIKLKVIRASHYSTSFHWYPSILSAVTLCHHIRPKNMLLVAFPSSFSLYLSHAFYYTSVACALKHELVSQSVCWLYLLSAHQVSHQLLHKRDYLSHHEIATETRTHTHTSALGCISVTRPLSSESIAGPVERLPTGDDRLGAHGSPRTSVHTEYGGRKKRQKNN